MSNTHSKPRRNCLTRAFAALLTLALPVAEALAAEASTEPAVGETPPAYVGRDVGGPDLLLDPGSGKAYVISFWASWCGPCREELPVLANIQALAGAERMQVIAVNIEDVEVYRKLRRNISAAGLTSTFDPDRKARKAFGVTAIPHMVIIGRDGRISSIRTGYSKASHEELAAALNQAMTVQPLAKSDAPGKPAGTP